MDLNSLDGEEVAIKVENNTSRRMSRQRGIKKYKEYGSISWRWPLIILGLGCLLYYCVYLIDNILPDTVSIRDAEQNPHIFCGERSVKTLKKLASLGQRVVGSVENEVLSPELIISELEDIKRTAHTGQSILYEIQKGEGAFGGSVYQNIKNVIAVLEGSNGTHSVLVNCHYDTVPSSVGASDDGINCAVMLELLRVLSKSSLRLKHNVVFLFNGAEEVGLLAAHLFLKHRWAESVGVVLNLEAAGLGGRAILFQSGPKNGWIFQYYARNAPHPHGLILGEELFQNNHIPSDTDFRIFRDFGGMIGLDFAFHHNGYVYHTIYDREEYISGGSHQHMGDNILAVLRDLGNAVELEDLEANNSGSMVYFDYLGWFMVRYSFGASIAINLFVFLLAVFSIIVFMGRLLKWQWLPQSMGPLSKIRNTRVYAKHQQLMQKFRESRNSLFGNKADSIYYKSVPEMRMKNINSLERYQDATILSNQYVERVDEDFRTSQGMINATSTTELWNTNQNSLSLGVVCQELAKSFGLRVCGMVLVLGMNCLMALFIDAVSPLAMPYYSNVFLIFPFYWCPGLAFCALLPMLFDIYREKKYPLSISMRCQLNLVASHCIWTLILFIFTCDSIRSAAFIMVPVLFTSMALLIIHLTPLYKTAHSWIWVYLFVHLPALLFQLYIVLQLYVLFIPVTGRSGLNNGDLSIALYTSYFIWYTVSFAIPLMSLVRKPWIVLMVLMGFSFFMMAISLPTNIGHPYRKGPNHPTPQGYSVSHQERKFYNESGGMFRHDWGYTIANTDRNSLRTIPKHLKEDLVGLTEDCEPGMEIYCENSRFSNWIRAKEPPLHPIPVEIILYGKSWTSEKCDYDFAFKGPDRLTIEIYPREGVVLNSWSVPTPIVPSGIWQGRPAYKISLVRGEVTSDYLLRLNFNITNGVATRPLLDMQVIGSHVHHEADYVPVFSEFISGFPDFATISSEISSYTSQIF